MRTPASELVRCARAVAGGETRHDYAFVVREGTIDYAGDYAIVKEHADGLPVRSYPDDRLIVPGFINGHSHAYQILLRGWADDWTFARWRSDALYKVVPHLTPDDVRWIFIAAFSEMLAAGITSVAEFFYLNGHGNAHAQAAIEAAEETGIRLVLARTWMDADYA
ncbi:MAG TPA: amidohydrolase family protein, partial [Candidatus Lustribacter sp.]